jgi:methanogenic corrinoid protein MtbC1
MSAFSDYEVLKTKEDIVYHLQFLEQSVWAKDENLFLDYVNWVGVLFKSLGIPLAWLIDTLACIRDALGTGPLDDLARQHVSSALQRLKKGDIDSKSFLEPSSPYAKELRDYSTLLIEGHRQDARRLIMDLVESGASVREIYLHIFQPAMYEVGRLWQTKRISVAQEHYFTAATSLIMAELYPRIADTPRIGRYLLATSVSGELHEMGIRMVADLFEMEGWDTYFLGASTPMEGVVDMLKTHEVDVLAVSATMTFHILEVKEMVSHVRSVMGSKSPKIIVGGYPFKVSPNLWKAVGADGFSEDAEAAVSLAQRLLG